MALKMWSGAHTKHRLLYHLVWIPKCRTRVLHGKVAFRLRHYLYEACKVNEWWIEEIKVLPDHVHVLIQVQPSEALSDVVQRLKGGTSYKLKKEFPELEEFIWGDRFWAEGYFAETIGTKNVGALKKYIRENADSIPQQNKT
jgi:REP-associated tyrosine transposase